MASTLYLPDAVQNEIGETLKALGTGTFRKFGFRIYDATLWTLATGWTHSAPSVLELVYKRALPSDILVDSLMNEIKGQGVADDATCEGWQTMLQAALPSVDEGDVMLGVSVPDKPTRLFHNETQLLSFEDPKLSKAFFDIWLGDHADPDLKSALLGQK